MSWHIPSKKSANEAFEDAIVELGRTKIANELFSDTRTSRLDRLVEQTKIAHQMGRELVHSEKTAGMLGNAFNAVKPMATKALGAIAKNPGNALPAIGAGVGAASGMVAPGRNADGTSRSRIGAMASRGLMGAGAGYGISKLPGGYGARAAQATGNMANKAMNTVAGYTPKFASIGGALARAGGGALVGGVTGGSITSSAERQGLSPGHHLRNAAIGAAGGAALGGAAPKILKRLPAQAAQSAGAHAAPSHWGPGEVTRIRNMMEGTAKGNADRLAWIRKNNPHLYPEHAAQTVARNVPSSADLPFASTGVKQAAKRKVSLPAQQLHQSLRHLSPQAMSSLQTAPSA